MLHTNKVIVVEGKYDAIKLANLVDAVIVRTDGFGIFQDKEKQELLRKLAAKRGLIVLTDSDSAGFLIRNFLKSIIPEDQLTHVYIPDVYGKERRKDHLSAEGKLGVEGIPDDVLISCLERAGLGDSPSDQPCHDITQTDFYAAGLSGRPGSAEKRQALQKKLGLPSRMTGKQLLAAVNALLTREQFEEAVSGLEESAAGGISLPKPVHAAIDMLETAGYEAYAVGGSIRDAVLGLQPNDWDITTAALPEQTEEVFSTFRVIETGLKHGTVTVLMDDMPLEITTYRIDGAYSDFRHPEEVQFTRSLREDLARRDFTMNALAYNPERGFVDEFGGLKDVQDRIIRCVGDPGRRFAEDALRILRALRFSATLGFKIEPDTAAAIHASRELISHVSEERVEKELTRMLGGEYVESVLRAFFDVVQVVIPELKTCAELTGWDETPPDLPVRMSLLLLQGLAAETPEEAEPILRRLRFPNKERETICLLIAYKDFPVSTDPADIRHLIGKLGPELIWNWLEVRQALDQRKYNDAAAAIAGQLKQKDNVYTVKDLAVTGRDLIASGIPEGPRVGQELDRLVEAVQSGTIENTPEALLAFVKGDRDGNR